MRYFIVLMYITPPPLPPPKKKGGGDRLRKTNNLSTVMRCFDWAVITWMDMGISEFKTQKGMRSKELSPIDDSGADPGILVRGGVDFFFQRHRAWGRLKAPDGARATPWWGAQGAKPPEAPEF